MNKRPKLELLCIKKVKSESRCSPSVIDMIHAKKQRTMSSFSPKKIPSSTSCAVDYLFVRTHELGTQNQTEKEKNMTEFLDGAGVFQIHLSVALSEY